MPTLNAETQKKIKNLLRCDAVFVGKEELEAAGISEKHIIIYS
jgi:hypothetical protein